MALTAEALYLQLGELLATAPDLATPGPVSTETNQWLGRAITLVREAGEVTDAIQLKVAAQHLHSSLRRLNAQTIMTIVHSAYAKAELAAPAKIRGKFIAAGNTFDAFATVGKVLELGTREVILVDPYADAKILTDYAIQAPENITIKVLADQGAHKASLKPAEEHWKKQFPTRPLEVRLSPARSLHDRLIIVDGQTAFDLHQSFNKLAQRAHTAISRVEPEIEAEKIAAYLQLWQVATPLA